MASMVDGLTPEASAGDSSVLADVIDVLEPAAEPFVLVIVVFKTTSQQLPRRLALTVPAAPLLKQPLTTLKEEVLKQLKDRLPEDVYATCFYDSLRFGGLLCASELSLEYFMLSASTRTACFTLQCYAPEHFEVRHAHFL